MSRMLRSVFALGMSASLLLQGAFVAPLGRYTAAERKHWAFQKRSNPAVPTFTDAASAVWAKQPVDAFVLARLQKEGLTPSVKADGPPLIRRLTFDLPALPPTPAEIAAFVADKSPNAWEKLVDRTLASPHY